MKGNRFLDNAFGLGGLWATAVLETQKHLAAHFGYHARAHLELTVRQNGSILGERLGAKINMPGKETG